jgi:hypothetical protein
VIGEWGVGPDERPGVGWVWELQLSALFGRLQPQKNLQLSLIPLNFVRPVTPKVAGSSPVAPAFSINDLVRVSYFQLQLFGSPTLQTFCS